MVGFPAYKYKALITKIIQIFGHLSILIHTHTHTQDLISFVVCCNWSFKRTKYLSFYQIKEKEREVAATFDLLDVYQLICFLLLTF